MAADDQAKQARDKLLDDLREAYEEFHAKEIKRIDAEEKSMRQWLKARGGAASLAKANAAQSKLLLIHDIGTFLTG